MRTQENLLQFDQFPQPYPIDSLDSSDDRMNITPKDKSYFFNNSKLCQYYGQSNIERCLILLFFLIVFSSTILYHYFNHFSSLLFSTIISTIFFNLFSFITYTFFLYKLKSGSMFDVIPNVIVSINDSIIIMNLLVEIFVLSLVSISKDIDWYCFTLFLAKFIIEVYFVVISVKVFMFCPGSRTCQEISERVWNFLRIYMCCCESDQEMDIAKYQKLEDFDSFY